MLFSPSQWQNWQNRLQQTLSTKRYQHSLATQQAALRLAKHWGLDEEKAALAGLVHDVARSLIPQELLARAKAAGLVIGPAEQANPKILHAPVGAIMLREEWGIADPAVLQAVQYHTIASPAMTELDFIIYLADLLEPTRPKWAGWERLHKLAAENLIAAMVEALAYSFKYLQEDDEIIHPEAYQAYEYFQKQLP